MYGFLGIEIKCVNCFKQKEEEAKDEEEEVEDFSLDHPQSFPDNASIP